LQPEGSHRQYSTIACYEQQRVTRNRADAVEHVVAEFRFPFIANREVGEWIFALEELRRSTAQQPSCRRL
jgi:hypothetical protein